MPRFAMSDDALDRIAWKRQDQYGRALWGLICPKCGDMHQESSPNHQLCPGCRMSRATRKALKSAVTTPSGYRAVPYGAVSQSDRKLCAPTKLVLEHRVIAARKIGRKLTSEEIVHHINGVKTDNRPENLCVMDNNEHLKLHAARRRDRRNNHAFHF